MPFDTLEQITPDDLRGVIGVAPERKRREYKRDLPGNGREERHEFVNDVTALANTEGGDIFFGVDEDPQSHMPRAVNGVPAASAEAQIAALENLLRDSIRPRLPSLQMHTVHVAADRVVLVIRVGGSHLRPHQSTLNHRFYARNTNGKYILDSSELSDMILRREDTPTRMRSFRHDRINVIANRPEDMPSDVNVASKLVLHYMPEQTFGRFDAIALNRLRDAPQRINRVPLWHVAGLQRYPNIDGLLYKQQREDIPFHQWYAQVFYDGTIEIVNGVVFNVALGRDNQFHPNWVEEELFHSYLFSRDMYGALGIEGRVTLAASALGIRDFRIHFDDPRQLFAAIRPIGRDPASFNLATIDSMDADPRLAVKPIADQLSRACGLERALSYNEEGDYIGYAP